MNKTAVIAAIREIDDLASRTKRSGGMVEYEYALHRHYDLFRRELIKAGKLRGLQSSTLMGRPRGSVE